MAKVSNKRNINNNNKEENLSLTKQQYFNFDTNTIENDNLPKTRKSRSEKKVVVIEKKVYPKFLITILLLCILTLTSYLVYHFVVFDHNKVTIKKVIVTKDVDSNYVFLGDSITEQYVLNNYYKNMHTVNSGIGGNLTTDILDNMNDRVYIYNPSKVFLLIGTNDININRTDSFIVDSIEKIVKEIKENRPNCQIYIESIYPTNQSDNEKIKLDVVGNRSNEKIKKVNLQLKELSNKLGVKYIDLYKELVDENDNLKLEYTKEGLHLTDEGYKKITDVLTKYIN